MENIKNILIENKIINKKLNLYMVGMLFGKPSNFILKDYIYYYYYKELNKIHNIKIY